MIGLMPIMGDFLRNRHEAWAQDLVLPVLIVIIVAAIIGAVFYRSYKLHPLTGFVATVLSALVLTNGYDGRLGDIYPVISAFAPLPKLDGMEGSVYSLIFIGIILGGAWGIGRLVDRFWMRRHWSASDTVTGGLIAVTISFALLAIPSFNALRQAWPQYFYRPPQIQANLQAPADKPDIYYIVLDRYASQSVLTRQFNFDNADFIEYLHASGYYVNPNSHQNYPYTTQSIASTLNADYNRDLINKFASVANQTVVPYHRSIQNSAVVKALKASGYNFTQIGTWYEATNHAPLADNFYLQDRKLTLFGHAFYINGFTQNEVTQSLFWRFIQNGMQVGHFVIAKYDSQKQVDMTRYSLSTLRGLAEEASGGRFIFTHLLIPHDPYFFNADGSISTTAASDNTGKPIKQKYLGQVQYINSQMKQILSLIKDRSHGQALVVLQADEGPYPIQLNGENFDQDSANEEINDQDMRSWSDRDLAMKYGNLAAYYLPGTSQTDLASGANNLNVFRLVLNQYFGGQFNYLPQCYYAYPNGRSQPMVYSEISQRLTSADNPACADNGTGPK